jgi:hypothetical protein
MRSKTHEFVLKVRFDKPCTREYAVREVKNNVHGEFYTDTYVADNWPTRKSPEAFVIKKISSLPRRKT